MKRLRICLVYIRHVILELAHVDIPSIPLRFVVILVAHVTKNSVVSNFSSM